MNREISSHVATSERSVCVFVSPSERLAGEAPYSPREHPPLAIGGRLCSSATSGNGRPRQEVAADEPHHLIESSQVERARTASQRLMEVWNGIGMASSSKTKPKTPAQLLPSVLSVSLRFVPLAVGCCTVPKRRVALLPHPLHPLSFFGTTAAWPQVGARPMQFCLFFFCPSAHHSSLFDA